MRRPLVLALALAAGLAFAVPMLAEPPAHAPAHGWRAKHKKHPHHHKHHHRHETRRDHHDGRGGEEFAAPGGFKVVFDPRRGVAVAVGFPDVFFHENHFYRHLDGAWQRSDRADRGWKAIAPTAAPSPIRRALPHPPSPAKLGPFER